jgi:light-regulated signal transduction histidine kinase (bacteriophytochrome)
MSDQELREALAELERSNADLEQFASILAHDLAAPLRVIRGFADLLQSRTGERLEPDEQAHLARIVHQAELMQAMIDALRAYARVGGAQIARQEIDTNVLVADILERLQPVVDERGAAVSVDDLPAVSADPSQLGQVFQNLLDNALKHAGRERPEIRVSAAGGSEGTTFTIADNGAGVPPERRERMFEMFTRGSTDDDTEHMGVGLAICRTLVHRHGGRIWIEDGQPGAVVRFTLP